MRWQLHRFVNWVLCRPLPSTGFYLGDEWYSLERWMATGWRHGRLLRMRSTSSLEAFNDARYLRGVGYHLVRVTRHG